MASISMRYRCLVSWKVGMVGLALMPSYISSLRPNCKSNINADAMGVARRDTTTKRQCVSAPHVWSIVHASYVQPDLYAVNVNLWLWVCK